MSTITPKYLHYTGNGSDKWYVVAVIDEARGQAITGYGPNKPNATGTWKPVGTDKAFQLLNEKRRKGYLDVDHRSMPYGALTSLAAHVGQIAGTEASLSPTGQILIGRPAAQKPGAAPKRRSARNNVWI
jgi:hypothetical protein